MVSLQLAAVARVALALEGQAWARRAPPPVHTARQPASTRWQRHHRRDFRERARHRGTHHRLWRRRRCRQCRTMRRRRPAQAGLHQATRSRRRCHHLRLLRRPTLPVLPRQVTLRQRRPLPPEAPRQDTIHRPRWLRPRPHHRATRSRLHRQRRRPMLHRQRRRPMLHRQRHQHLRPNRWQPLSHRLRQACS